MLTDSFLSFYLKCLIPAFVIGCIADLIFGDPHCMWHPVRLIGALISRFERGLRKLLPASRTGELAGGALLVIIILACTFFLSAAVLFIAFKIHWIAGLAAESYLSYTVLAAKSLKTESMKVYSALETDGLEAARKAVSMIVGRDTSALDEAGVTKAAVETVAENTSDGVIAPLLFLAVGGPVTAYIYKAVNTMDSMVGYKNEKYLYFGRAAARADDALNFFPSRISALLMIFSAYALSLFQRLNIKHTDADLRFKGAAVMNAGRAVNIYRRDRRKHASPNSAQTESVMAGALGIQLSGDAFYFGEKHKKPLIGDALRPAETADIVRACRLMYMTGICGAVLFCVLRMAAACVLFFTR